MSSSRRMSGGGGNKDTAAISNTDVLHEDKYNVPVEYFTFDTAQAHADGMIGIMKIAAAVMVKCMEDEVWENSGNTKDKTLWNEYRYIADESAAESKLRRADGTVMYSANGEEIIRDQGHTGKRLVDFWDLARKVASTITKAEVAALRMYTGEFYVAWNSALRNYKTNPEAVQNWATCLNVLYSAVLKLMTNAKHYGELFRGLNESNMELPQSFLEKDEAGFAGGVEMAMMSTTADESVALDYSGGTNKKGTILHLKLHGAARGADIQFLSLFPREREILFPPCTYLTCTGHRQEGNKRYVEVIAAVSHARNDVNAITEVTSVPTPHARESMPSAAPAAPPQNALLASSALSAQRKGSVIDQYSPLIRRKLDTPTLELNVDQQIELLTGCMDIGEQCLNQSMGEVAGKDMLVIIGNTGAGKSSFANFYLGCEMKLVDPCTLNPPLASYEDVLVVRSVAEGGPMDELLKIGHSKKSETFVPQIAAAAGRTVGDCPGFLENRGPEIAIANAVNIKTMLGKARSVRLLVLIEYTSLSAARGHGLAEMVQICSQLFGSDEELQRHASSIQLSVTKCPTNKTLDRIQRTLKEQAPDSMGSLVDRLFLVDPLGEVRPGSGFLTLAECRGRLDALTKITNPEKIFQTVLNAPEENALISITNCVCKEIYKHLEQKEFPQAADCLRRLQQLQAIQHPTVTNLLEQSDIQIERHFRFVCDQCKDACALGQFGRAEVLLQQLNVAVNSFKSVANSDRQEIDTRSLEKHFHAMKKKTEEQEERDRQNAQLLENAKADLESYEQQLQAQKELYIADKREREEQYQKDKAAHEQVVADFTQKLNALEARRTAELDERFKAQQEKLEKQAKKGWFASSKSKKEAEEQMQRIKEEQATQVEEARAEKDRYKKEQADLLKRREETHRKAVEERESKVKELEAKLEKAQQQHYKAGLVSAIRVAESKRENPAGISPDDLSPLESAIMGLIGEGIPTYDKDMAAAVALLGDMKRQLDVQKALSEAISWQDYDELKSALNDAEDLILKIDSVIKARALFREFEAERRRGIAPGEIQEDEEEIDEEELERERQERLKKAANPKYHFTQYANIRSVDDFAKGVIVNKQKVKEGMLKWQSNVIQKSLLNLDSGLSRTASRIHKHILGYMGDKTMSFPATLAQDILQKGLEVPELVDEIYMQIMKQLSNNPKPESVSRGWQLMCMCVGTFPPSREFENHLLNYILEKKNSTGHVGNYGRYSLRRLEGMLSSGASGFVPPVEEIQAYKERPPILATIELVDGTPLTEEHPVTPDLNVAKVLEICTHYLDLQHPRKGDFGIFVVDIDDDELEDTAPKRGAPPPPPSAAAMDLPRTPRPLRNEEYMGDVLVQKARQGRAYKFVFKRKIFLRDCDEESEDEMFNRLVYLQAADEVITGNIPVTDEATVVDLTAKAVAVDLADEFPDNPGELLAAAVMEYVPVPWRAKYSDDQWASMILAKRGGVVNEDPDGLQANYVDAVKGHELYGTHFFHVIKVNDPEPVASLPANMIAAFNSGGLHFLDEHRKILMSFGYEDMYRWGGSDVDISIFSLVIWNKETEDTFKMILTTPQTADMAAIILDYINAIMAD